MISNEQLKEFGFEDINKFPQMLTDHVVTISLPSAIAHQLDPVNVVIKKGLAIPVQMPGVPNGMIVRDDGKMIYIAHEVPNDFSTPLKVSFTDNIAFDVRIEAFNIMRRAVEVNPALQGIWLEILSHWTRWYPLLLPEINRQKVGAFNDIKETYPGIRQFLENFIRQTSDARSLLQIVPFRIIVQTAEEDAKGWQGEEFLVLESTTSQLISKGLDGFMVGDIYPPLKKVLRNPVFYAQSSVSLYFEPRVVPVLKILLIPPVNQRNDGLFHGIDL